MIEQCPALHVAVTFVAPVGEVCEREADGMFVLVVVGNHVFFDIATAEDALALETDPVLSDVAAIGAGIFHILAFK